MMLVLGLETSCDETAASLTADGHRVLSSVVASQISQHALYGGVVPEIASRSHLQAIVPVTQEALDEARCTLKNVDGIAVTLGPGLIGSLLVGVQYAKGLAAGLGKPLVGLNHLEAHVMASFLVSDERPPPFPFIGLVVSGGHTSMFLVRGLGQLELIGKTLDDAAGEALDKAGSVLGLPYPGGMYIDQIASEHNPDAISFPRAMVRSDTLNVSFSGLKTALRTYLQQNPLTKENLGDIAASFLEAVVDILQLRLLQAAQRYSVSHIVIGGGVAANRRLRKRIAQMAEENGLVLHLTPKSLCTDNAAMVAGLGYHYLFGELSDADCPRGLDMDPFQRNLAHGW